jgi:hypothetical protein
LTDEHFHLPLLIGRSHFAGDRFLCVSGGCGVEWFECTSLCLLEVATMTWSRVTVANMPKVMLCKHAVACIGDALILAGGGSLAFSFGACFNTHVILDPTDSSVQSEQHSKLSFSAREFGASSSMNFPSTASTLPTSSCESASSSSTSPLVVHKASCVMCGQGFPSRNTLYRHVVKMGHQQKVATAAADASGVVAVGSGDV